eukprot:SAG11_NODE_18868_length_479_cov_1.465789_1_plen_54_part_10
MRTRTGLARARVGRTAAEDAVELRSLLRQLGQRAGAVRPGVREAFKTRALYIFS